MNAFSGVSNGFGSNGFMLTGSDGQLGLVMSVLSGIATALAVTIAMTVYLRMGPRSWRDRLGHGLAVLAAIALLAFAAWDTRHAALAYLGLNPSRPALAFEIRMPREMLAAATDGQIELRTDRNETLALVEGVRDLGDGRALLRGAVGLTHRTADRLLVVSLPGQGTFAFRLRLPAEPHRAAQFGPWHLADRIASSRANSTAPQDSTAIRYRVF